jgi:hypothetical protein
LYFPVNPKDRFQVRKMSYESIGVELAVKKLLAPKNAQVRDEPEKKLICALPIRSAGQLPLLLASRAGMQELASRPRTPNRAWTKD